MKLTSFLERNHVDEWFDVDLGEVTHFHLLLYIVKLVIVSILPGCATSQTHVSIAL